MYDSRWTIRGVDDEARAIIASIHKDTGIPYGRLLNIALWEWIDSVDMDEPVPITRPYDEACYE